MPGWQMCPAANTLPTEMSPRADALSAATAKQLWELSEQIVAALP
jgi:hypothetical protein